VLCVNEELSLIPMLTFYAFLSESVMHTDKVYSAKSDQYSYGMVSSLFGQLSLLLSLFLSELIIIISFVGGGGGMPPPRRSQNTSVNFAH